MTRLQEPGVLGSRGCLHSTGTYAPAAVTASYSDEPFGRSTGWPFTVKWTCFSLAGAAAAAAGLAGLCDPGIDVATRRPELLHAVQVI